MRRPERGLHGLLVGGLLALAACASTGEKQANSTAAPKSLSAAGRTNLGLAQGYLDAGDLKRATQRADLALASDPGSADVHALYGLIHTRNGRLDKAQREFERALALAPNEGRILNVHASWLCGQGKYEEADSQFQRALRNPRYAASLQGLSNAGKCAHQAGHWALSEGYLRRALAIAPTDARVLLLLADAELRQGKLREAQAFIQRRDALGSDARTLELAASIEEASGNPMAAARYRQRLKEEFPDYRPTGEGARSP